MCTAKQTTVYWNTKQSVILIQAEKCFVSVVTKGQYLRLRNTIFQLGHVLIFKK